MTNFDWIYSKPKALHPDRKWLLNFALVTALLTTIPYLIGYSAQGEEWKFSGFLFGIEDGNSYIAKMLRGSQGDWLFRTPYTTFPQDGIISFFPYLLLGKLAQGKNQHDQLISLYHAFRITGIFLYVFAVYDFSSIYLKKRFTRKLVVFITSYGGGLGWILVLSNKIHWLGSLPLDFYSPESFGFLGFFGVAHIIWARVFALWGIRGYLIRGSQEKSEELPSSRLSNLHPSIYWFFASIIHPLAGFIMSAVIGFHLLGLFLQQLLQWFRKKETIWSTLRRFGISFIESILIAIPLLVYYFFTYISNPFVKRWSAQTILPTAPIMHYVLAYGLILPFVIFGAYKVIRQPSDKGILLLFWCFLGPLLLLLPYNQNRRLIDGLWVALVTIAFMLFDDSERKNLRWAYSILILVLPTTIFLLAGSILVAMHPNEPAFIPAKEAAAFCYLAEVIKPNEVVLCSYETCNALPAWTPSYVLSGLGPESIGFFEISEKVKDFFQLETEDNSRNDLIKGYGVNYLFWGPNEQELGKWVPLPDNTYQAIYDVGDYQIYKVISETGSE